jgi:hypothetical protein
VAEEVGKAAEEVVGEAPEAPEGVTDGATLPAGPAMELAEPAAAPTAAQISVLRVKTSGVEG